MCAHGKIYLSAHTSIYLGFKCFFHFMSVKKILQVFFNLKLASSELDQNLTKFFSKFSNLPIFYWFGL
jgi:hypothetical protein